ncbi:OPT-domain-containing protein [Meredithblackwellia eburnea MCA 4105]
MVFGLGKLFSSRPSAAIDNDKAQLPTPSYNQPGMFSFLPPTRDGSNPGVHFPPTLAQGHGRPQTGDPARLGTARSDLRMGTAESNVNPDFVPRGASRGKHDGQDGGFVQGVVQSGASIRKRKSGRNAVTTHVLTTQINEIRNSVHVSDVDVEAAVPAPAPSVFSDDGAWSGTTVKKSNDGHAWSTSDAQSTLAGTEMQSYGLKKQEDYDPFDPPRGVTATTIDLNYTDEPDEDSPFPEVRASVSNFDDPDMPVATFRSIVIGLFFSAFFGGLNCFFYLRYPSPILSPPIAIILAYPIGKAMAWFLPMKSWRTPRWLRQLGFSNEFSFNSGPFNIKEHALILIMTNTAIGPSYAISYSIASEIYYGRKPSVLFDILFWVSGQTIGLGVAGIARRFLVWPAGVVWPQILSYCTLMNTLHAEEDEDGGKREIARNRLLLYVAGGAFCWYFLPGFLFQALSYFSFICWMAPNNIRVNQLFGVSTGLGMGILTFDWSQIAYLGSPLVVPWWAIVNISVGFALVYWFLAPILYYSNAWNTAFLPLMDASLYDRFGSGYDISNVLDMSTLTFNATAYHEYSPIYMPVGYILVYASCFALTMALLSHTVLYHGKDMWRQLRNPHNPIDEDVHLRLMKQYDEVPDWWYGSFLVFMTLISIFVATAWGTILPVWALLLALFIGFVYVIPGGYVFALSTQQIVINTLVQLISGHVMPGNAIGGMVFKTYAMVSQNSAMQFIQGLKIGHYMKVPPRTNFIMQLLATTISMLAQLGVKNIIMSTPDACLRTNTNHLTCPQVRVAFSSSIIWALIGPARVFGKGGMYNPLLWSMLIGFLLPVLCWLAAKRWPNRGINYINIPVMLTGLTFAPPATGNNYSSWMVVGFIFQYWGRKNYFRRWSKYNFIVSGALDVGTALSILFMFFTLQLPKNGTIFVNWWGNNVFANTLDWMGGSLKVAPEEGFGPTSWK